MAEGAGDARRAQSPVRIEEAAHADHGVAPQQLRGDRRIVEVGVGEDARRESVGVDLEPDRQGGVGAHRLQSLMDAEDPAPEHLVAERVVAEGLAPLVDHAAGVGGDGVVRGRRSPLARRDQRREGEQQQGPGRRDLQEQKSSLFACHASPPCKVCGPPGRGLRGACTRTELDTAETLQRFFV